MTSTDRNEQQPRRARNKRQFLLHLDGDLIRRIKVLAVGRNVTASSLVEEAMLAFVAGLGDARDD